ncbi:hypothetical protein ACA910_000645 [Epithemia clementina (nom. ined.)]
MSYGHHINFQDDAQLAADMQMAYDLQAEEELRRRQNNDEYSQTQLGQSDDSAGTFSQALSSPSRTTNPQSLGPTVPVVQGRPVPPYGLLASSFMGSSNRSNSGAQSAINSDGLSLRQNQSLIFVPAEINGRVVEMMVDTGAQSSVISAQLMRTLDLQSKLNTFMQGVAQGVGQARILGVIENCPVSIGHVEFLLYFLVLDVPQDMMIMGIDQMRRFKCLVDLENNRLVFGGKDGVEVSFLPPEPKREASLRSVPGGCPVS